MQKSGKEILEEVLTDKNLNYNSLAKAIGLKRAQNLYDVRDGKVQKISNGLAALITEVYPEYSKVWLMTGIGDKQATKARVEAIPVHAIPDEEIFHGNTDKFAYSEEGIEAMRVNVVPAKAQLGYPRGFADPEYFENLDFEIIPIEQEHRGYYLGFETVGYSMVNLTNEQWAEKSIFPKRIAIGRDLDKSAWRSKLHMHNYDAWIIVHKDGILLKEIIDHDVQNGIITIHSWNPDKETYPDETLFLGDVLQLLSVVRVIDKRR